MRYGFLLTRSSRSVTKVPVACAGAMMISTHTLLAERDLLCQFIGPTVSSFLLTRSSRSVTEKSYCNVFNSKFLLTRSSRSVTFDKMVCEMEGIFLLTRSSRSVTLTLVPSETFSAFLLTRSSRSVTCFAYHAALLVVISTHTLLAERDHF